MLEQVQRRALTLEESEGAALELSDDVALLDLCAVLKEDAEVDVTAREVENALCDLNAAHDAAVLGDIVRGAAVLGRDEVIGSSVDVVDILHERGGDNIVDVAL